MPRDSSGNYTLPAGNPVVSGTVISSTWANPTMADLAAEMTNSLSRNGQGGMLVPFQNASGTAAAPGITWADEPNSGWYRAGLNDFRYSLATQDVVRIFQNKFFVWNPATTAWDEVKGGEDVIRNYTLGETVVAGDICAMDSTTGKMMKADANVSGKAITLIAEALAPGNDNDEIGFRIRGSSTRSGLTPGGAVYLSEAAGEITQTAPVTGGAFVRILGFAASATVLELDVSPTFIELNS